MANLADFMNLADIGLKVTLCGIIAAVLRRAFSAWNEEKQNSRG